MTSKSNLKNASTTRGTPEGHAHAYPHAQKKTACSRCTPLWKGAQRLHALPRRLHAICTPSIDVQPCQTGVQSLHACLEGVQSLHALWTGVQALHACRLTNPPPSSTTQIRKQMTGHARQTLTRPNHQGQFQQNWPGLAHHQLRGSRKPFKSRGLREPTGVQSLHACPKGVQALHALQTGVQALHACLAGSHAICTPIEGACRYQAPKILLSQPKHIQHGLEELGMQGCKSSNTPLTPNLKLKEATNEDHALLKKENINYCNSSWGDDPETRTSQSGYLCYLFGTLVSLNSSCQHSVTYLSTEAELNPLVDSFHNGTWLKALLANIWNLQLDAATHFINDKDLNERLMMDNEEFKEKFSNTHFINNKGLDDKLKPFGPNSKT
ncbi:hypothetical protein PCASD_13754 [Puccinia coronata f. sp. avenae]|uniref:Reverse transcriptase Ty1/copia-type domain-containing protein n=1 Tax=Puccinia coronata f. sp. avenae TaxID=200324 RepID=A0A2N5UL83_9BASI|nr:hypothetical protein PCASD_13754 [Puccinia coronata f. sp. avenae]